jgi:site-specific DNA-cytosine methylase
MGVKDEDSDKIREVVSKSQCYKLAGNSIVVDVMVYMFDQLFFGNKNANQQLELF